MSPPTAIAVDIGNSRMKLGVFAASSAARLSEPTSILFVGGDVAACDVIPSWLKENRAISYSWAIASVNRPSATRLIDWLREARPDDRIVLLSAADLPLEVRLELPDYVGIDRLVDAVAANRLRQPDRPAVVVDVGSAITVDYVDERGTFCGGAILPGLAMSARAMHEFTDMLPLIETADLGEPPPALGLNTKAAMQSGLFWGAVGAVRQLVQEMAAPSKTKPHVFLTGGAGEAFAGLVGRDAVYIPHLTLGGIFASLEKIA